MFWQNSGGKMGTEPFYRSYWNETKLLEKNKTLVFCSESFVEILSFQQLG